jgi:Bacterial PH domain
MVVMMDSRKQAVTGVVPPQLDEATIRVVWPSVAAFPGPARLGRALMGTMILAPLGWLLLAPLYFLKVIPGLARRFVLTNRRVMFQKGFHFQPVQEVLLADIDDVRLQVDSTSNFYRTANLEILSQGKVVMTLRGVPNPESFRHAILNACKAWIPGKAAMDKFIPASAAKSV